MTDANHDERRQFERFSVDFEISVYKTETSKSTLIETTTIDNISGGGVSFYTTQPYQYSVGQRLEISIHLPDCDSFDAYMKSFAKVVRIVSEKQSTQGIIGLQLEEELDFESKPKSIHSTTEESNTNQED